MTEPDRSRLVDHVVSITVAFIGLGMTIPVVVAGVVALGGSVEVAFAYALFCCVVLYFAGVISRNL